MASIPIFYNIFLTFNTFIMSLTMFFLKINNKVSMQNRIIFILTVSTSAQICISFMMITSIGFYILHNLNGITRKLVEVESHHDSMKAIRIAANVYDKLCDSFESISTFFTPICLVFLLVLTFFNVLSIYTFFVFINTPEGLQMLFFYLMTISWAIAYMPFTVWVIAFASATRNESSKTAGLLLQLLNKNYNEQANRSSKSLMLQLSHRKPTISCGFFEVNWKLLFAIVGSVFSFSLIVIQFSDV